MNTWRSFPVWVHTHTRNKKYFPVGIRSNKLNVSLLKVCINPRNAHLPAATQAPLSVATRSPEPWRTQRVLRTLLTRWRSTAHILLPVSSQKPLIREPHDKVTDKWPAAPGAWSTRRHQLSVKAPWPSPVAARFPHRSPNHSSPAWHLILLSCLLELLTGDKTKSH